MRLLVLSPISPLPIYSGARTRLYHITRYQARRHQLTYMSFCRSDEEREGLLQLARELDIRVVIVPFKSKKSLLRHPGSDTLRMAKSYMQAWRQGLPEAIPIWEQPAMHRALQKELSEREYDIMQVEWPYMAPYALRKGVPTTVLVTYDVFSVGLARRAGVAKDKRKGKRLQEQARRWKDYEEAIYPRFDLVAAMSEHDATIIRERSPRACVFVFPNGVDAQSISPNPVRPQVNHLIFVGAPVHAPNIDGACWLLSDIWPELHRRHPQLTLTLVNLKHPQVQACAADKKNVIITDRLPELTPVYRQADVALAPLRAASGTRLKILEAFAHGVPVVSTFIGYEGLHVTPGEHLLRADTPAAFISAIEQLIDSHGLRKNLSRNARVLVEQEYDWEEIVARTDERYARLLANGHC